MNKPNVHKFFGPLNGTGEYSRGRFREFDEQISGDPKKEIKIGNLIRVREDYPGAVALCREPPDWDFYGDPNKAVQQIKDQKRTSLEWDYLDLETWIIYLGTLPVEYVARNHYHLVHRFLYDGKTTYSLFDQAPLENYFTKS